MYSCFEKGCPTEKHQSVRDNTERHDGLWLFTVALSSSRVFSAMEGGAINTCLRVLKETKWIFELLTCLFKFIEYFPGYLSALSHTLLRFFGQPLSKQLYTDNVVKGRYRKKCRECRNIDTLHRVLIQVRPRVF